MKLTGAPDIYDKAARKKPVHVSINADLLAQAKALNISLARTLEVSLEELVRAEKRRRWLEENREAIQAYNKRVKKYGVFSEGMRTF